jgi:hypothetical protein
MFHSVSAISQSDQIGKIFADWTFFYFGRLFEKCWPNFGLFYPCKKLCFFTKMVLATHWAIFSQTHQVTLAMTYFFEI